MHYLKCRIVWKRKYSIGSPVCIYFRPIWMTVVRKRATYIIAVLEYALKCRIVWTRKFSI